MSEQDNSLAIARIDAASAKAAYHKWVRKTYSVGRIVYYDWGAAKNIGPCSVVRVSGDRIFVRNNMTGKARWLYETRIHA